MSKYSRPRDLDLYNQSKLKASKPKRTRPRKSRDRVLLEALLKDIDIGVHSVHARDSLGTLFVTQAQRKRIIEIKMQMKAVLNEGCSSVS